MRRATLLVCLGAACLLSCHSKDGEKKEEIPEVSVSEIPKDIHVPLKMWEVLAKDAGGGKEAEKKGEAEGEGAAREDSYVFSEVNVILKEKNPGIIRDGAVKIALPRGGGEIDLSHYVLDNQGSFYVSFDFPAFADATGKKVLFISHSRKRKINDQIFGSGCHAFFDITRKFLQDMGKEGLKVNTTRNRHVSVLAGSFILMAKKAGQSYITQVTFTDSGNKNLLCPEKQK